MRRREFADLLGGAAATWPTFASAQHVTSPDYRPRPRLGAALAGHVIIQSMSVDWTFSITRPGIESPIDRRSHPCMQFESFASPATPP